MWLTIVTTFLYVPCTDLPIQMKRSSIKTTTGYLKSKYQLQRLIIGSDHNMDFLKHEKHRHTRDFMERNLDYQLLPTVTKPTRITMNSSTLIDNIFIGRKYQGGYTSNIGISDISYHLRLILNISNLNPHRKSALNITTRKLDTKKRDLLNERIQSENWEKVLNNKNANDSFTIFHNIIQKHLNEIALLKTVKIPPKRIKRDEWMTCGLMKCLQKQKKLYMATLALPKMDPLIVHTRTIETT